MEIMIQVWIKGQGFKKKIDGFKQLHKGDRFRTFDGNGFGPIMVAKSKPYRTFKKDKFVWAVKADFDLEFDL